MPKQSIWNARYREGDKVQNKKDRSSHQRGALKPGFDEEPTIDWAKIFHGFHYHYGFSQDQILDLTYYEITEYLRCIHIQLTGKDPTKNKVSSIPGMNADKLDNITQQMYERMKKRSGGR